MCGLYITEAIPGGTRETTPAGYHHTPRQICRKKNLIVNKVKCHLRLPSVSFFGEIISSQDVRPDPRKQKALTDMPPQNSQKELQAFLGILN